MTIATDTGARPSLDEDRLLRYLLGELSSDDEAGIEAAMLEDDTAWEAMRRAEDELIDAYVRGRLDGARRARFDMTCAASPRLEERVALARSLREIALAHGARRRPGGCRRLRALLGATGLTSGRVAIGVAAMAVLVVILWSRDSDRHRAPRGEHVALLVPSRRRRTARVSRRAGPSRRRRA